MDDAYPSSAVNCDLMLISVIKYPVFHFVAKKGGRKNRQDDINDKYFQWKLTYKILYRLKNKLDEDDP